MNDRHVGDDAELYALGALSPAERERVDRHIQWCTDCLRRVGEAEETILHLEHPNPSVTAPSIELPGSRRRQRPLAAPIAAAAALVIGYLLPHEVPTYQAPLALLHSHFSHAQFVGHGPLAKVLYAKDRSWYYVLVEGAQRYHVVGTRRDGSQAMLGDTIPHGATSDLFISATRSFDGIALEEGSERIETAQIR